MLGKRHVSQAGVILGFHFLVAILLNKTQLSSPFDPPKLTREAARYLLLKINDTY